MINKILFYHRKMAQFEKKMKKKTKEDEKKKNSIFRKLCKTYFFYLINFNWQKETIKKELKQPIFLSVLNWWLNLETFNCFPSFDSKKHTLKVCAKVTKQN